MSLGELREAAIIATFIDRVRSADRFCGETLIQKATFFLKELFSVSFEAQYHLYHYGPFSFDLREKLQSMEADDLVKIEPHEYGATFSVSSRYPMLQRQFPRTILRYEKPINFVATELGPLGVKKLESLATALYVARESGDLDVEKRVVKLRLIKPHIDVPDARGAVAKVDAWLKEAQQ